VVKIDIHKIKMEWLSIDCLVTLSKYVQIAHEHDGSVLPLQSEDLLRLVVKHVKTTDSVQLQDFYKELKGQIKVCLADPRLKAMLSGDIGHDDIEEMSSIDYRNFAA